MPRADYKRFAAIAQEEMREDFFLQTPQTDPRVPFFFMKVRMNGTEFNEGREDSAHDTFLPERSLYCQGNMAMEILRALRHRGTPEERILALPDDTNPHYATTQEGDILANGSHTDDVQ